MNYQTELERVKYLASDASQHHLVRCLTINIQHMPDVDYEALVTLMKVQEETALLERVERIRQERKH